LFRCVLEFRCGWLGWYPSGRLKCNQPHRNSNTHRNKNTHPVWWYNRKVAGSWWWMYWCPKHVEHRRSEIKLNKFWHQVGLLFFSYHNDARSNINLNIYKRKQFGNEGTAQERWNCDDVLLGSDITVTQSVEKWYDAHTFRSACVLDSVLSVRLYPLESCQGLRNPRTRSNDQSRISHSYITEVT